VSAHESKLHAAQEISLWANARSQKLQMHKWAGVRRTSYAMLGRLKEAVRRTGSRMRRVLTMSCCTCGSWM